MRKQVQQLKSSINKLKKEPRRSHRTICNAHLRYTDIQKETLIKMRSLEQKLKEHYALWEELLQVIE